MWFWLPEGARCHGNCICFMCHWMCCRWVNIKSCTSVHIFLQVKQAPMLWVLWVGTLVYLYFKTLNTPEGTELYMEWILMLPSWHTLSCQTNEGTSAEHVKGCINSDLKWCGNISMCQLCREAAARFQMCCPPLSHRHSWKRPAQTSSLRCIWCVWFHHHCCWASERKSPGIPSGCPPHPSPWCHSWGRFFWESHRSSERHQMHHQLSYYRDSGKYNRSSVITTAMSGKVKVDSPDRRSSH